MFYPFLHKRPVDSRFAEDTGRHSDLTTTALKTEGAAPDMVHGSCDLTELM